MVAERINQKYKLNERYKKVDDVYNKHHHMTWIRENEFNRAYASVKTHAISTGLALAPNLALVPIFDLWNHQRKSNCKFSIFGLSKVLKNRTESQMMS